MNWATIITLMQKGSGATQKFYTTLSSLDEFGPTLVGMANTQGGTIVVGFDPRNYHLLGCPHSEDWFQKASAYCNPPIQFTVTPVLRNDKTLMVVTIPDQSQQTTLYKNTYYVMNHDSAEISEPPVRQAVTVMASHVTSLSSEEVMVSESLVQDNVEEDSQPTVNVEETRLEDNSVTFDISFVQDTIQPIEETEVSFESDDFQDVSDANTLEEDDVEWADLPVVEGMTLVSSIEPIVEPVMSTEIEPEDITETESFVIQSQPNVVMPTVSIEAVDTPNLFGETPSTNSNSRLNKRQQGALDYLNREKTIQNKKYRELFQVSHKTAHLELVAMVENGIIKPSGAGRSTCYILTEA